MELREMALACGLLHGLQGEDEKVEQFARLIRMEFFAAIHDEYDTWSGTYKPVVKAALQNLMQRMDADATIE